MEGVILDLVYRAIKILFLLFAISSFFGFLRTYLSPKNIKESLVIKKGIDGHVTASILGAATPFSSQSSTRLFLNFLDSGVPLGISLSFLITAPIINEFVAILMVLFFGWKIALIYLISGIIIGTTTGFILGKFNLEKHLKKKIKVKEIKYEKEIPTEKKVKKGLMEGLNVIIKLWPLVLLGLLARYFIITYLPGNLIEQLVEQFGAWGVPIAILLGTPFPGNGAAIIPITFSLFEKGIPLGTAFGFLLGVVALSFPKIWELKKVMESKLLILFTLILISAIAIIGYLLNFII